MTRLDFFKKISNCETSTPIESLINLIQARGFLVEHDINGYYLSDNSHPNDAAYLDSLLRDHFGYIEDSRIILKSTNNITAFFDIAFKENESYPEEECYRTYGWDYFKRREHGFKVSVSILEAFIARYVKAVSSCGVILNSSCDGNQIHQHKLFLCTSVSGSRTWHKLIYQNCLPPSFAQKWSDDCFSIDFNSKSKYDVYYELNQAAAFLYEKRIMLRNIKKQALADMGKAYLKTAPHCEIEKRFIKNASILLNNTFPKQ